MWNQKQDHNLKHKTKIDVSRCVILSGRETEQVSVLSEAKYYNREELKLIKGYERCSRQWWYHIDKGGFFLLF